MGYRKCIYCGKPLKTAKARELGYGSTCYKKHRQHRFVVKREIGDSSLKLYKIECRNCEHINTSKCKKDYERLTCFRLRYELSQMGIVEQSSFLVELDKNKKTSRRKI